MKKEYKKPAITAQGNVEKITRGGMGWWWRWLFGPGGSYTGCGKENVS